MSPRLAAIAATVALATVAAASPVRGAVVQLRVDSSTAPAPLYDGTVATSPHAVDGSDGSGAHPCTGPPSGPTSATATGALDDAMRGAGIAWRGNWDPSFRDFFIDRIGPYASAPPDNYWSITVNGDFVAGGCLTQVADGDRIRFHFGPLFGDSGGGAGAPGASPGGSSGGGGPSAAGASPSAKRLRGIARRATRFLRGPAAAGDAWGRLALTLRAGHGFDRAAFALVEGRCDNHRPEAALDVNATAICVLALGREQPHRARRAAQQLVAVQLADGGFGFRSSAVADVDTTGLVTWALTRAGLDSAARRAAAFIRAAQAENGGFPALPGGVANSQSTGLALVALRVTGLGPRVRSASGRSPLAFLASSARRDGAIAYAPGANPTPAWSTAQALLGLTSAQALLAR